MVVGLGLGLVDLRRITVHGDVAEESQGIRLIAVFFIGTGPFKRLNGKGARRFQMPGVQMRFA